MNNTQLYKTLVEALEKVQTGKKGITYIEGTDQENTVTYHQLYKRALALLKVFQEKGLSTGDELIILTNNNEVFLEAFWACLLGAIVPVPVAVGMSDEHRAKLLRIFEKLEHPHIYTDEKNYARLNKYLESNNFNVTAKTLKAKTILVEQIGDISAPGIQANIAPDTRAFIQFSSGSTSEPKGVILTHRNLMANIYSIGEKGGYQAEDIDLSWMPLTHDLGLIGFHLTPLVYNQFQYLMPTELFSRRPALWLKKTSQHRATILGSPNFGYKHLLKSYKPEIFSDTDLSSVRVIFNGAEPISVDLCEVFLHTMAAHKLRHNTMCTVYGLAEASVGVAFPEIGHDLVYVTIDRHEIKIGNPVKHQTADDPGSVRFAVEGKALANCELKITDLQNNSLPDNHIGEIQIKGLNVTSGYYRDEAANKKAFTGDGWLNTGDVGFIFDGQLVVAGRTKDIIFVNGQNYYPHDLEQIALCHHDLELGKIVACGITQDVADHSELLIFIQFRGGLTEFAIIAKEVSKLINEHMGLGVSHVIPVRSIPKTTSGKVQRNLMAIDYLDGKYQDVIAEIETNKISASADHEGNLTELESQLLAICNHVVTDETITLTDNLFEIGISSLVLAEIFQAIDDLYPGRLDITDLFDYQSLAELAVFIDRPLVHKNLV